MESESFDTALVVEGGALRGVFSTGVLDGFLENRFNPFDFYIGVSSGASNLAAYLAEMKGRNAIIYMDYSLRPQFISAARFVLGGHLIDLDWLWTITIREIRLNLQRIYSEKKPLMVVLTDVETGKAIYRTTCAEDLEPVIKASSAVPFLYRGYLKIDGRLTTDGGVADAIPVGEAIRSGARRIMVIRSRRQGYRKRRGLLELLVRWHSARYPLLQQAMLGRVRRYNDSVALIHSPPPGVSIIEVCPPENFRVSRFSRNLQKLREGYEQGRTSAREAIARWEKQYAPSTDKT